MLLLGASMLLTSCGFIKGSSNPTVDKIIKEASISYDGDGWIEEVIEEKIEDLTGISVDLSPNSPEVE